MMRILLFGACTVLLLGVAPAFAGDSGDMPAATRFTMAANAQARQASAREMQVEGRQAMRVNAVQARALGTWLHAPAQGYGQN